MKTITAASMLVVSLAMGFLVFLVGASRAQEDWQAVAQALGKSGTAAGSVYRVGLPRTEPTGGGKAAITCDFVLVDNEVGPVMQALRDNGIEVTALHNHMVGEQPRLYFMHFGAHDDALKLAAGLKAALAHINIAKS